MSDSSSLETALTGYQYWRDVGNDVLLVGLIADILIAAFLEHFRWKRWLEVVATLVVVLGVWAERRYGGYADDASRQIRAGQETKIAALNLEAETLKRDNAVLHKRALKSEERSVAQYLWTDSQNKSQWLQELGMEMDSLTGVITLLIQPVPDFHVQLVAHNIARMMRWHGWDVRIVDESVTTISPFDIAPGPTLFAWNLDRSAEDPLEAAPALIDTDPAWLGTLLLDTDLSLRLGLKAPVIISPSDPICEPFRHDAIHFLLPTNGALLTIGLLDDVNPFEIQELIEPTASAAVATPTPSPGA